MNASMQTAKLCGCKYELRLVKICSLTKSSTKGMSKLSAIEFSERVKSPGPFLSASVGKSATQCANPRELFSSYSARHCQECLPFLEVFHMKLVWELEKVKRRLYEK
eukprot:540068-Pelagomonas_calceolata.AAC.2